MKKIFLFAFLAWQLPGVAQELYVFTEPASTIPAYSGSAKLSALFAQRGDGQTRQRYRGMLKVGLTKKWMLEGAVSVADMHTPGLQFESAGLYAQYRFFSADDVHQHFRMAAFGEAAWSRAPFEFEETALSGDKSGIRAGIIATQLWHKFALSGSISHTQVLNGGRFDHIQPPGRNYQAMDYTVSGGYLLFPRHYRNYRQLNLNLYSELLMQQSLDRGHYFVDAAPALQVIIGSIHKINLGYRFEVAGSMERMSKRMWVLAWEPRIW